MPVIRYFMAAQALKFFSLPGLPRKFYRDVLGNYLGAKKRARAGLDRSYIERSNLLLSLCRRFDIVGDGRRVLEIGSGWTHYYGVFLRLFYDVELTLVDVWNNRQFDAFQRFFTDVRSIISTGGFHLTPDERERGQRSLQAVCRTTSFPELYRLLGCEYIVDPSGVHASVHDKASYDLVFSFHVQEHVFRKVVQEHINSSTRLVKPGGFQLHQIGIDDHLAHFDDAVSEKNYLRYSDKVWKRWFDNDILHHNRVQRSEWIEMYERSGMTLLYDHAKTCSIDGLTIDPRFARLDRRDLACTILTLVFQKRGPSGVSCIPTTDSS
jgi:hypothetical protein